MQWGHREGSHSEGGPTGSKSHGFHMVPRLTQYFWPRGMWSSQQPPNLVEANQRCPHSPDSQESSSERSRCLLGPWKHLSAMKRGCHQPLGSESLAATELLWAHCHRRASPFLCSSLLGGRGQAQGGPGFPLPSCCLWEVPSQKPAAQEPWGCRNSGNISLEAGWADPG